jgi:plasmid stabilization system protein ParE
MARIKWRIEAIQDIDRLRNFLFSKDQESARKVIYIIYNSLKRLETMPEIGRPLVDGTKRRELTIPFGAGAYIIRYVLENNNVYILRVWHGKENR